MRHLESSKETNENSLTLLILLLRVQDHLREVAHSNEMLLTFTIFLMLVLVISNSFLLIRKEVFWKDLLGLMQLFLIK